ncbi:MAG: toxin-activating lysine-acyltransferase [Hyphomicrobiaceae bacterium]
MARHRKKASRAAPAVGPVQPAGAEPNKAVEDKKVAEEKKDAEPTVVSSKTLSEDAKRNIVKSKMIAASFGGIVTLLMRSPEYRHLTLADLEWLVVPAMVHRQFALMDSQLAKSETTAPVAVALWANVSQEVDERLSRELDKPVQLSPAEWKSGDIPWLIAVAGEKQAIGALLRALVTDRFKFAAPKMRVRDGGGVTVVGHIHPSAATPAN